jgi:glycogen operon protein
MLPSNWDEELARAIAVFYNGGGIGKDSRGRPIEDVNFLLCFNSNSHSATFTLPGEEYSPEWELVLDTAGVLVEESRHAAGEQLAVSEKSVIILRAYLPPTSHPDRSAAASVAMLTSGRSAARRLLADTVNLQSLQTSGHSPGPPGLFL